MNHDPIDIEAIEDYLLDNLDDSAKAEFEKRLSTDPELSNQVDFLSSMYISARKTVLKDKMAMLKHEEAELKETGPAVEKGDSIKLALMIFGGILICFFIYKYYSKMEINEPVYYVESFIPPTAKMEITRATIIDSTNTEFNFAYNLYKIKDYKRASYELEKLYKVHGDTTSLKYAIYASLANNDVENFYRLTKLDSVIYKSSEMNRLNNLIKRK